jgi:hypothetical protein
MFVDSGAGPCYAVIRARNDARRLFTVRGWPSMHALTTFALAGNPPQMALPSLGDAPIGWLLGIAALLGPLALVIYSWQRKRGQWWAALTQWRTPGFWLLLVGDSCAAIGIFTLMGVIPAWQAHWNAWYIARLTGGADPQYLAWLQTLQGQYATAWQISAAVIFGLGALALILGQMRLARQMAFTRNEGPDDWLVDAPVIEAPSTSLSRLTHPLTPQP